MNTPIKKEIPLKEIEQFYRIEENGNIFSFRKQKYLKTTLNTAGYKYVMLTLSDRSQIYAIHRLVAVKYIGQCPYNHETSHKDGDKYNNHYSNLEYLTHAANILKSFREHGRRTDTMGHHGEFSPYTKQLMSDAKKKPVRLLFDGLEVIFPSIGDAAKSLYTYRKHIYLSITKHKPFNTKDGLINGVLSFI